MLATIINAAAILIGGALGSFFGDRINKKYTTGIMAVMGFTVAAIGIQSAAGIKSFLVCVVSVAVGAAFAFHAGRIPQAPRWMQRACLEWLYRLCAEPRRLWRRYLVGNPRFLWLAARQWLTGRPAPLGSVAEPAP